MKIYKFPLLLLLISFFGCEKEDAGLCDDSVGLFQISKYPIGVAIDLNKISFDGRYREIAINQFDNVTPENIFKFDAIQPMHNVFSWDDADLLADFCSSYNKGLHGHTLIWHQQLPSWLINYNGSKADWERVFKTHIQALVKHFRGKVKAWDVVNEAFNEDGTLRNSIWKQKIGSNYIEKAFIYARQADPDVLLFYNDYSLGLNPTKRKAVIQFLNNLRNRGIKVDGVGLQMHIATEFPENTQIAEAIRDFSDNHYLIHLSEIDISVNFFGSNNEPSPSLLMKQADKLAAIVNIYNEIPVNLQYGITFWGISDKDSWIRGYYGRKDYPLLYDDQYQPKPAYCKLKRVL